MGLRVDDQHREMPVLAGEGGDEHSRLIMARIDLIDICKTLKDRAGVGSRAITSAAEPAGVSAPSDGGRGSTFSIQKLALMQAAGEGNHRAPNAIRYPLR